MQLVFFLILFLFPFFWILVYFISLQLFFSAMKEEDETFWDQMGQPHIIKNNSIGIGIAVLRSFFTSSYHSSTKRVIKLGDLSRILLILAIVANCLYPFILSYFDISFNN